jgi:glycosyltransferase involved in cell wall biosynthesis
MVELMFRAQTTVYPEPRSGGTAMPATRPPRLALIVTGDRLCGIAAYATAIQRHLSAAFEVTWISLDQYRLRGHGRRLRRAGDRHIAEICTLLPQFDAVNLQFEHGTLGRRGKDILRRFRMLVVAAPRLSVTFHSLPVPLPARVGETAKALLTGNFHAAAEFFCEARRNRLLSIELPRFLRRAQRRKPISAIVHTARNARDATYLYGIDTVYDHPLSFLSAEEAAAIRARATRRDFPVLETLPDRAVLIGVFGFISKYKGFEIAIRALHHLPDNYHLLVFGGIHPQEIIRHASMHPYLSRLFDEAGIDHTLFEWMGRQPAGKGPELVVDGVRAIDGLMGSNPRDLSGRIHFMGALADDEFLAGMVCCDAVVFPYLEVGQSSSGPISLALELGCRVIASRTQAFVGFAEYHPGAIEFFDIGNHIELAGRLRARRQYPARDEVPQYNVETNKAVYVAANSAPLQGGANASSPSTTPTPGMDGKRDQVRDRRRRASAGS